MTVSAALPRLLDDPATRAEWLRLQQRVALLKQPRQLRQQPRRLPSAESNQKSVANMPPNSMPPLHPPLGDLPGKHDEKIAETVGADLCL